MEGISKDLSKLESKSCSPGLLSESVQDSIEALERWKAALLVDGDNDADEQAAGRAAVEEVQKATAKLSELQKEWSSATTKYGKTVEKRFNTDLSPLLPIPTAASPADEDSHMFFASDKSKRTIDEILAMHFVRSGKEGVARSFLKESGVSFPQDKIRQFSTLQSVSSAIRQGDLGPAFRWVDDHRAFLEERRSPLEYHLHRSQFVRLLLSDTYPLPPSLASAVGADPGPAVIHANGASKSPASTLKGPPRAMAYARLHFARFYSAHLTEISRLSAATLYLPVRRLLSSPYADLFSTDDSTKLPAQHADQDPSTDPAEELYHAPHLISLFASEFCRSLNMSQDLPLKVVTDIGGGGALAKIAKVRGVMKEKRTEWTTVQELPVEIPVPSAYRYHSVFACPVSKEQGTETNPPMMMPCGHVVANQTLLRLCKNGQNVRCPYCPLSSAVSQATRVYF